MLSNSIISRLHSCPPTARALGWVPAAGQPPSSPSCMLKRAAGVQQLPTGSFSSQGCVNESLDIAEALVLGRAQRCLEQSQHFKCSGALPGILGRGMAEAGTTSLGGHLGAGGTREGRHQNIPNSIQRAVEKAAACHCPTREFHQVHG